MNCNFNREGKSKFDFLSTSNKKKEKGREKEREKKRKRKKEKRKEQRNKEGNLNGNLCESIIVIYASHLSKVLSKHYHGNLATLPINYRRLFNSWKVYLHLPFQLKCASIVRIVTCLGQ